MSEYLNIFKTPFVSYYWLVSFISYGFGCSFCFLHFPLKGSPDSWEEAFSLFKMVLFRAAHLQVGRTAPSFRKYSGNVDECMQIIIIYFGGTLNRSHKAILSIEHLNLLSISLKPISYNNRTHYQLKNAVLHPVWYQFLPGIMWQNENNFLYCCSFFTKWFEKRNISLSILQKEGCLVAFPKITLWPEDLTTFT